MFVLGALQQVFVVGSAKGMFFFFMLHGTEHQCVGLGGLP